VGIPKGRFNPGQYAPTYGAEPPPGLPPGHYSMEPPPGVDKQWPTIPEAGQGKLDIPGIVGTGLASKGAAHYQGIVLPRLMNPGKDIPAVGTPMVGYRSQELARQAMESRSRLQADPTSAESQRLGFEAYEQQADALADRGMTPGQREDAVTNQLDADINLYINEVAPNLLRTQQAESAVTLPIMEKVLDRDQTFPEFINTISQDPRALVNLMFASIAKAPEALILGTLGAGLGFAAGNPILGGALGVGAGAATSEVMIGFNEALRTVAAEEGFVLDASTEEGLRALLDRPDLLAKAMVMNQKRAGVVGLGIAGTALLTGKLAQVMFKAGFRGSAVLAAATTQAVGESGTEGLAQLLSGEQAATGGYDKGAIFAEGAASLGTAAIPISVAALQVGKDSRQNKFNNLKEDIESNRSLSGDTEAEYNEILKQITKKYPDIVIDTEINKSLTAEGDDKWSQGNYNEADGTIHMSLKAIIGNSSSKKEALERAKQVATRHERVHQVLAVYRARGDIEDDPVEKFLETNYAAINEWLKSTPAYDDLAGLWKKGDAAGELTVAEEYMIAMGESDTGLKGKVKLWALRVAKKRGWDIDASQDARLILQEVLDRFHDISWAPFDSAKEKQSAVDESGLPETRSGGLQSKSRRDFMRNAGIAGAGIAIDPSIVLEPGSAPPTETVAPQFSGFGAGPGVAPEMEGVLRAAEADAMPTTGLAFDDFNPEQALEEDRAKAQQLKEFEENQEKENQAIEEEKADDQEKFIKAVEEVISIYGTDAPITDDLESGKLNERIKAIADETGYPEAELSRAVQNYIEDLTETKTEVDMFANITRKNMTPGQVITRNFNNFVAKRGRAAMNDDKDKLILLDRLRKVAGGPATKLRDGDNVATTDKLIELTRDISEGKTKNVIAFIEEQEGILTELTNERIEVKRNIARADYAASVNKDVKDLASREPTPKFEKFMSPKLASDLNTQRLESGEITQAEFNTAEAKIAEAQNTIRNTNELKRYLARNVLKGFDPNPDQLAEIQRQAEFVPKPSTKADIKIEAKQKVTSENLADSLDAFIKSGGTVKKLAPGIKIIHETGTSNAKRIMSTPWIDTMADPNANTADFGEVEIEGESFDGFSVNSEISSNANVVRKPSGYTFLPDGEIKAGNVAFTSSNQKVVVLRELKDDMYEVQWNRAQSAGEPNAKKSSVTINVHKDNLRGTTSKDASENLLAWNKEHKEMFPGKTIGQLTDIELKKLVGAHTAEGVGLPDSVKRRIYTRLWGKKNSNDIAKFINSANYILGKKFMSADHTIEIDQMITPGVLKSLLDGTASEALLSKVGEVLDQSNLTFMPQFLNDLKKHLRHFPDDAKANALNEWYNTLNEFLDEGKKTDEGYFIDSHLKALQSWIGDEKNLAVFSKSSAAYKSIQELKALLAGPNAGDLFAEFGGTKEDKAMLEASLGKLVGVYQNNLKSKGVLSTNDENLVNAFSTAVKSGLEFNASVVRKKGEEAVDMPKVEAHFTSSTLYNFLSFSVGRVTFAVDAFNRESLLGGSNKGDIPAAAIIANLVYRNPAASGRPEGMETGTDMIQELSLRTGEFQSKLSAIFSKLTSNEGVISPEINAQIIDHLAGKEVVFKNKEVEAAAKEMQAFMDDIYKYAKGRTGHLKTPLDLRGAGDTVLPRVWNTQYIATKEGKDRFLRTVADKFTDPDGKSIFEEIDITPEDLYTMVVNSGGFVQGDWRQNKQDQTTSTKEVEKGELIQEYLDSLTTEELVESGLIIDDLQAILPRFINKAVQRTEYSAIFGSKDEILRSLIQAGVDQIKAHNAKVLGMGEDGGGKIIDEKQFKNKVWDMSNILRGKYGYESVDLSTRRGLQILSNVETIAKLPFVMFASIPELGTMAAKGSSNPAHFAVELGMATAWAGYKAVNGLSKLLLNKHLPAMRKHSSEIGGLGIIRDIQLLREMGIADIHAMGDVASTRYVNPSFAPGGIKSGAKSGIGGRIPKRVRAVFNMQTFMQATMLTTLTEMQQFMALRNFQRHMGFRMNAVGKSKGKTLKGKRAANRLKQYKQDMLDYGLTEDVDISTPEGEAAFNAATLRFVDQVITRPNDATTAKIFRNPLTAPLVLFKRFITTYGNTLLTSIGRNMVDKVDNVERSKQVGKLLVAGVTMYGGVMFAEMMRAAIKGDLEDEDSDVLPKDYKTFMHRVDRMGVLGAPGSLIANLTFPSKAWYGDTGTNRIVRELTGPLGSDMAGTLDYLMSNKKDLRRLLGQISPITRQIIPQAKKKKKKKRGTKLPAGGTF
jgi:hypothetical protein